MHQFSIQFKLYPFTYSVNKKSPNQPHTVYQVDFLDYCTMD